MSVVGLTLGSAANATRPSAAIAASVATSAITRVVGCVRSYQTKPTTRTAPRSRVHAARRLVEQEQLGVRVEHELQGGALALAARDVARVAAGEGGVRHVGADRLVHQVVAGVLGEQRGPARAD